MRVVVIGAGYAGMMAANKVARKTADVAVTVVNPRPRFVERVRLHQQVAATAVAAKPLTAMLRGRIDIRVGAVAKIGDGTVVLDDGCRLDFDHAVLAVGSRVRPLLGTIPVGIWEGAQSARRHLAALRAGAVATVVGAGPTGIETASEIAAARPELRVRLIGSVLGDSFSTGAGERVLAELRRLSVELVADDVTEVADDTVRTASGAELGSDLTLWGIIGGVPELAADSGLAVNARGQAVVDEYLRSVTDPRIFAAGDCAAVPGARFSCQCAVPQGGAAAANLVRTLTGRPLRPFSMRYRGRGVSLGRKAAVVQFTEADDTPKRGFAAGAAGVVLKEAATRSARFGAGTGWGA